jgi:hypothetical protein
MKVPDNNIPEVIREASQSPLGIFALMIIAISLIGFFFFRTAEQKTRLWIFLILFGGVVAFGLATSRLSFEGRPTNPAWSVASSSSPTASPVIHWVQDGLASSSVVELESRLKVANMALATENEEGKVRGYLGGPNPVISSLGGKLHSGPVEPAA